MDDKLKKMHSLLEDEYSFPCSYTFKFIVPVSNQDALFLAIGEGYEITTRPSKKGNYVSLSAVRTFKSASEIIDVYVKIEKVPGVIAL
jgi:putative lipoic acid-binding regulatory protein